MRRALRETALGLCCEIEMRPGVTSEIWFPKSQIDASSQVKKAGDFGTLVAAAWCLRDKGLA